MLIDRHGWLQLRHFALYCLCGVESHRIGLRAKAKADSLQNRLSHQTERDEVLGVLLSVVVCDENRGVRFVVHGRVAQVV